MKKKLFFGTLILFTLNILVLFSPFVLNQYIVPGVLGHCIYTNRFCEFLNTIYSRNTAEYLFAVLITTFTVFIISSILLIFRDVVAKIWIIFGGIYLIIGLFFSLTTPISTGGLSGFGGDYPSMTALEFSIPFFCASLLFIITAGIYFKIKDA